LSFEEAEVLRERAEAFLENAKHLIKTGSYDLAAFNLEQHCQLLLKYKLLIKTGTYPRTHSLTRLADELAKLEPQTKTLLDREDNMLLLTKLEDACIGARHLPRKYREREVEAMLRFVMEVFKPVVERV
jgi:HEPN domain-containing protein